MKKYLKDASVLSIGILISRILGLIFVFPFSKMIGQEGLSLYTYAYVPYTLFLDISTLGIPIGISKLVSKYNAHKDFKKSKDLFRNSIIILTIIGFIFFVLLNIFAKSYSYIILGNNDKLVNEAYMVENVIRIISLSVLIIPVVSVFRGYLQGNFIYKATSISQIGEQFFKVSLSLIFVYLMVVKNKMHYQYGVYAAISSIFVGSIVAFIVVYYYYRKNKNLRLEKVNLKLEKNIIKEVLQVSIPFGIFGISFGLFQFFDSLYFNRALIKLGFNNSEQIYGIMSFNCQKLIFIPISLLLCIVPSILPRISKEKENNDIKKISFYCNDSMNKVLFLSIPIVVLTVMFSKDIYDIFFQYSDYGKNILKFYSLIIVFFVLNGILTNVLLGMNYYRKAVFSLLVGLIVKFVTVYGFLIAFSYYGSIISSVLGFFVSMVINIYFLIKLKLVDYKKLFYFFIIIVLMNLFSLTFILFIKDYIQIKNIYLNVSIFSGIYLIIYFLLIKMSHLMKNKII